MLEGKGVWGIQEGIFFGYGMVSWLLMDGWCV